MNVRTFKVSDDETFCDECGAPLKEGDVAYYDTEEEGVYCIDCIEAD